MNVEQCKLGTNEWVTSDKCVVEVARYLKEKKLRRVYVVDSNGAPVGIISSTDISNHIVADGKDAATLKATDIMTRGILIVNIEDHTGSVAIEMDKFHVPSVAVVKSKKMIGVLTVEECAKACLTLVTGGSKNAC